MSKMPKEILIGKRTILKRLTPDMADEVYKIIDKSRDSMSEFLPMFKTISAEHEREYLVETQNRWNGSSQFTYAIFINNQFAGTLSLNKVNFEEKTAEIGYWLGEEFEGKGYMTESVDILINEAKRLKLNELVISCDVNNHKSANIAKRLGFILKEEYYNEKYNRISYRFLKII